MTWPAKPWLAAALLVAAPTYADPPLSDADVLSQATQLALQDETIEIHDDAPAESASSVHLDRDTLAQRPHAQMSDLLRDVPGLVVAQHAGGGKADQYFIRGFDADHGTDIAVFADGVPVNLSSHGHGQGYADTHWMIPETIDAVDVHKGPYAARFGDYATAGALELNTLDRIDAPTFYVASSLHDHRAVAMASPSLVDGDKTLLAAQIADSDGPFVHPLGFAQANALAKWQGALAGGWLKLETNLYTAHWNASGQLPETEVAAGRLGRFDSIDPSEGGKTSRYAGQVAYAHQDAGGGTWRALGYVVNSKLDLFSDFTLYARDTVHGDEIEQTDGRWLYGLDAAYDRTLRGDGIEALITAGAQLRADDVVSSLWHDAQRTRLSTCFDTSANPCNETDDHIRDLGAYVEANIVPSRTLHVFPGVRVDRLSWDVANVATAVPRGNAGSPIAAGSAARAIASPKLSVELHESEQVNLFANAGGGFHSNDARAAVASRGDGALARAWGGELGARVKPDPHARLAMDIWYLWLSSEQVWNGDAGTTEPSAPTQRLGFDLDGSLDATPWLSLDANVTFSHASFVANAGNANAVALAPRWMGAGGATVHGAAGFVAVRARGIADRPGNATGTLTAPGYLIVDVIAGRRWGKLGLDLTVNNALDTDWREAQFADSSRVSPTADVVEQMHFTPGVPLTATVTASYQL